MDLVAALRTVNFPYRLLIIGDGELRVDLEHLIFPNVQANLMTGVSHAAMAHEYAGMNVLVLPSQTTTKWAEHIGRVLVEALWCGAPIIGSDSGAVLWVVGATGGGVTFPEGDARALAEQASSRGLAELPIYPNHSPDWITT